VRCVCMSICRDCGVARHVDGFSTAPPDALDAVLFDDDDGVGQHFFAVPDAPKR